MSEDSYDMVCSHDTGKDIEVFSVDTMCNGEYYSYEVRGYVCADPDCREQLEGDPDMDDKEWFDGFWGGLDEALELRSHRV